MVTVAYKHVGFFDVVGPLWVSLKVDGNLEAALRARGDDFGFCRLIKHDDETSCPPACESRGETCP